MKTNPTVSIIMPLYNKEEWVADTITSILSQSFHDYELIVINDGSTDKSVEIVKSFQDDRIQIFNQKNCGVSTARNRGISKAKGKYITFIDADDIWRFRHLEYLVKAFELNNNIIMSTNEIVIVRDHKEQPQLPEMEEKRIEYKKYDYIDELYKNRFSICVGSSLIKRELLDKIEWFYEDISIGEDVNFFIRIACEGDIISSNYVGMVYMLLDKKGAMLSTKRVEYLPKYLKGINKRGCPFVVNLKLKKFIFIEYLKKGYQNRGYPLEIKELKRRDAGEVYRLGVWSILPYMIVRYMPKYIFKIVGKRG